MRLRQDLETSEQQPSARVQAGKVELIACRLHESNRSGYSVIKTLLILCEVRPRIPADGARVHSALPRQLRQLQEETHVAVDEPLREAVAFRGFGHRRHPERH